MKTILIFLLTSLSLISCGDKNTSGGKATSNDVDSNTRYVSMAGTAAKVEFLNDVNYRVFKLRLLKNGRFFIYQNRGARKLLFSGKWRTEGAEIYLPRVGKGSYLQSTFNGVVSDCIALRNEKLGALVLKEFRINGYSSNQIFALRFCRKK